MAIPLLGGLAYVDIPTDVISAPGAIALAEAMDINPADIMEVSLAKSDERGAGVGDTNLSYFPTMGNTFAILSTGRADSATLPNNEGDLSFILDGLNNALQTDLVQLTLKLNVPEAMNCVSLDFAFYTEEHPEFVGTRYRDVFTIEKGGTNLSFSDNQLVAPLNFALDPNGGFISSETTLGLTGTTGTTYDGRTPLLRAQTPVAPGETIQLVFSIQDLGDSIYDSAVFLDNFQWSNQDPCEESVFTAVTLARFEIVNEGDQIRLIWETAAEIDNEGFNLWRAEGADGEYNRINPSLIPAQGNPDTGASYEYVDRDIIKGVTYFYKLEDVDFHGVSTFHGPVSIQAAAGVE